MTDNPDSRVNGSDSEGRVVFSKPRQQDGRGSAESENSLRESQTTDGILKQTVEIRQKTAIEAFSAIVTFINELWEIHQKDKPLSLYRRLVQHIKFTDIEAILKSVRGFKVFLDNNEDHLLEGRFEKIPRETRIKYGDHDLVFIDVQKFIYKGDKATREAIRQHLITIGAILDPNKTKLEKLESDEFSPEHQFVSDIMTKAQTAMANMDTSNPMNAVIDIFKSGIVQDMIGGLQNGVESGQMDPKKLLGTMQNVLGSMLPDNVDPGVMNKFKKVVETQTRNLMSAEEDVIEDVVVSNSAQIKVAEEPVD